MDFWFPLNNPIKPCVKKCLDTLLQPIIKITEIIPLFEKTNVKSRTVLVSMDVMSVDTNIPQNEGIKIICKAYENFYKDNLFLHITCRKCLNSSSKKISRTSMESTTYKPMKLQWTQRQQFSLPTFLWHIFETKPTTKRSLNQQFRNAT